MCHVCYLALFMLNLLPKRNVWLFNAHGINSLATTAVRILCKSKGLSIPGSGNYVVPTLWKKRSILNLYCSRMLQYGRHRQRWEFSHRFCNTRNGRFERRFKEDNFDCVKSGWTWCIVSTKARLRLYRLNGCMERIRVISWHMSQFVCVKRGWRIRGSTDA